MSKDVVGRMTGVVRHRRYICILTACTVEVLQWMSALSPKETVNIASEMHSSASRGPPSCCMREYFD